MPQAKAYLVGAGPGDAELITLKGYQLICRADVILYDHLIPPELLKLARPNAQLISVGKSAGRHTIPQPEINKLLVEKAKQNNTIVRLKGGDPFLFGRGAEEAQACFDAGIDFELVPGITSAIAAPSYAGIPATHRDYASSVAVITGHRKDDQPIEIPKADTLIFLMGVANIQKIIQSVIDAGWPGNTKIAAIQNGTCYNQKVITGTLENFVETVRKENLKPPAVFVVGKVVELHETLNWFSEKPRVLVLGMHPEKYKHLGTIVHRQIIDCVPLNDYYRADRTLKHLDSFDWLVFTSANGVRFFFKRLNALGSDARALASVKIAAIGKTTAETLTEFGIVADMVPDNESSAGLLEKFSSIDIRNKRFLLPQSDIASAELPDGLVNMGAEIEKLTIYKTVEIDPPDVDFDYIDRILFTSSSTVRAFVKRFGPPLPRIKVYALGPPTQAEAKKHNIDAEVLQGT
ncbi:MAG: uroporphyrinogen-III C-methyltransferase [Planctomycetota bacterium]|nr:MAG: uroporphyrinogen-III C-methyltransferase [Planctomycetota bacterium]